MLRELRKLHHVTYLALDDGTATSNAVEMADEYCHELIRVPHRSSTKFSLQFFAGLAKNVWSPLPYVVEKYRSPEFSRRLERESKKADLVVCDFLAPSVNVPERLSRPTLLFQHNAEAVIWRRYADTQTRRLARLFFREQWRRMKAFEHTACRKFDAIVAVSAQDRSIMEDEYGAPLVRHIPTGVDTAYFCPSRTVEPEPYHLVFSGSMDWLPNDDAMKLFSREILPRIRASLPAATVTIVGRNPLPGIKALAREHPFIRVTGAVEDVRPYIEQASVYVIPLRIAGGTRLKVFEAMAMEKPIVSTSIGVEGLPVTNGTDVLIADEPQAFADAVVHLLRNRGIGKQIGLAAAAKVRTQFGWKPVAQSFLKACDLAIMRWAKSSGAVDGWRQTTTEGVHHGAMSSRV